MASKFLAFNLWKLIHRKLEIHVLDVDSRHLHNVDCEQLVDLRLLCDRAELHCFDCLNDRLKRNHSQSFIHNCHLGETARSLSLANVQIYVGNFVEVAEDSCQLLAVGDFLVQFLQKSCTLLGHYCIVSLESDNRTETFNNCWQARPSRIACTTNALSDDKQPIVSLLRKYALHARSQVVQFIKQIKFLVFNIL
jgi:hypothetical protein